MGFASVNPGTGGLEAGQDARDLRFARDHSGRAVVTFAVVGLPQAHSWDTDSGAVVASTSGDISAPRISPDGNWVWWYDRPTRQWWRRPFGASPRGAADRPLRLTPSPDVDIALGGDGTAVVSRPAQAPPARMLSLLPVGRVRHGAEPVFLGMYAQVGGFFRSVDDTRVAIDTGASVLVCSAYSGALLSSEETAGRWSAVGFTSEGSVLLVRHSAASDTSPILPTLTAARIWNPRTALRQEVSLHLEGAHPTRLLLGYRGKGALLEARMDAPQATGDVAIAHGRTVLYSVSFDGAPPVALGPSHGSLTPSSATAGPGGQVYATWQHPEHSARLVDITAAERMVPAEALPRDLHRLYPPAIGGYGPRPG